MSKQYKKITQKKTKVRISPENAEKILEQEFTDSKGNKFNLNIIFKPHKPSEPTIEGFVKYNDKEKQNGTND